VKKLYIGNLPYTTTEEEIRAILEPYGAIISLNLINDRMTGRFRGFGFVELEDEQATKAMEELDGKDYGDRPLRVNEAHERSQRRFSN